MFFSIRALSYGPPGDVLRQYRLIANPPWESAEEAIQAALAGEERADAMMSCLRALATAEGVLSGRTDAAMLPVDLQAAYEADWENELTRLCAAAMAVAREEAVGGDAGRQHRAFEQVMASRSPEACTSYAVEWREAWSWCLDRMGLGRAGYKASIQGAVTPSKWVASVPISALPRVVGRCARLAAELESAGRPEDAARVRSRLARTLRGLMATDVSAANAILCADLIVEHGLGETGAAAQRDRLRSVIHGMASSVSDLFDATRAPPPPGSERLYLALQAACLMAMSMIAMTIGSAIAAAIGLVRVVVAGVRAKHESGVDPTHDDQKGDLADVRRMSYGAAIVASGLCAVTAGVLSWARSGRGESPIESWVILDVAAFFAAGIVATGLVAQPPRGVRDGMGRAALFIGFVVMPFVSNHSLVLAERWARAHSTLAVVVAALLLMIVGMAWFLTRADRRLSANSVRQASVRALIAMNVFALAALAGSLWALRAETRYGVGAFGSTVHELDYWFDPATRDELFGNLGVTAVSTQPGRFGGPGAGPEPQDPPPARWRSGF